MTIVVAALFKKDNKILIAQRLKGDLENKWEFPGGKVETGETDEQALIREIKEEMNIDIKIDFFISNVVYKYHNNDSINLKLYSVLNYEGNVILNDHKQIQWIKKNQIKDFEFAPDDKEIIKKLGW